MMEPIKSLKQLEQLVKVKSTPRMVVAYGQDADTIRAVNRAQDEKIIDAILVGNKDIIIEQCRKLQLPADKFEIVDEPNEKKSGEVCVKMIVENRAQILMKGLISTPYFLKAILNKEYNLVPKGTTLSHTTLIEVPTYDKLLIVSDVAMIPEPDLQQKIQMINYNIKIAHTLGIDNPKIALVGANEKVTPKMQATVDAAVISKMADRKQIKGAIIDGPLALDVALSKKACEIKNVDSPIDGHADVLIFPNIDAGNIFFKSMTILAHGTLAGMVTGTPFPTLLVSRADDEDSKYYSIVFGALMT
jgi:phosphate butyryltransferase